MFKEKFGDKIKDFRTWKQEHCAGPLMINTCSTPEQIQEQIENLTDIGSQVKKMQDKIPKMFGEFVDGLGWDSLKQWKEEMMSAIVGKGAEKFAYKKVPVLGQANMISDAWAGKENLKEFTKTVQRTLPQLTSSLQGLQQQMQSTIDNLGQNINTLEKIKDGSISKEKLLELQKRQAQTSPCIKARKCLLEPYGASQGKGKSLLSKKGCCSGQTPHHLIPNSMIQNPENKDTGITGKKRNISDCETYTHGNAPNVCVEGTNQSECTHKEVHDATADFVEIPFKNGQNNINTAIDEVVKAHQKTFKASGCTKSTPSKPGCIESQLRHFFKKKCGSSNFKVRSVDGKGKSF